MHYLDYRSDLVTYENSPDVVVLTANGPRAALPRGEVTSDQMSRFLSLRGNEIIVEARRTLADRAAGLTDEDLLRLFYCELREQKLTAVAAD